VCCRESRLTPTPNTCDLYFALDKTSSFKLVPTTTSRSKVLALSVYRLDEYHAVGDMKK